jgi:hypothetical protein
MTECTKPTSAIVGTFKVGEKRVGEVAYEDAVVGLPLVGQARVGAWWAYLCADGLALGTEVPEVTISIPERPPAAGLRLGAVLPAHIAVDVEAEVLAAGLALGATVPLLTITSRLATDPAGLALGAPEPRVAITYLWDDTCTDLDLTADAEQDLALVGAGAITIEADPEECL